MAFAALAAAGSDVLAVADPDQLLPARQMMAFTLGFHIILVPFGVAFTCSAAPCRWSSCPGCAASARCCSCAG